MTMEIEYGGSNFIMQHLEDGVDEIQYKRKGAKLVKNYYLGEVLGEGAYGKVKDGMDTFTQKRVAIKILKRARLKKIAGGEASVLKEINITKKLHSKHVIKLIDHFTIEEKGKLYIVYEYVGGGTLQNLLESAYLAKLPQAQAQSIFNQLIVAIEYIHSQKILHRDIKPDNILFTNDGILKLTDFGVSEDSSLIDDLEVLSRSYGSPAFQPPELTSFQRSFSPFKVDIWAMGVTLYLMTIGKFPFYGTNMYMLFENISKCNIDFPPNIDKDLCSLIKGILQIDHNQRFTIEQIKSHPWCTKLIESNEPFVPLLPESKFDPLEMAYGNCGGEDDDLMFGYEDNDNSYSSINSSCGYQNVPPQQMIIGSSIPLVPPPTINSGNNNNNNNNNCTTTNMQDRSSESSTPTPLHYSSNNNNHISSHYGGNHHMNQTHSVHLTSSIIENYEQQDLPTHHDDGGLKSIGSSSETSFERPLPGGDSPPPPLRNSSRRPKITFESPHNKKNHKTEMQEIPSVIQHYILSKFNTKIKSHHLYHVVDKYGNKERTSHLALVCKRWFQMLKVLAAQYSNGVSTEDLPFKRRGRPFYYFTEHLFSQYLPLSLAHVHTFTIECDSNDRKMKYSTDTILSIINAMTSLERVVLRMEIITFNKPKPQDEQDYVQSIIDLVESINHHHNNIKIQAKMRLSTSRYDPDGITNNIGRLLCNGRVEVPELKFRVNNFINFGGQEISSIFVSIFNTVVSLKLKNISIGVSSSCEGTIPLGFKLFNKSGGGLDGLEILKLKVQLVKIRDINVLLQSKTIKTLTIRFQWHNEFDQFPKQAYDPDPGSNAISAAIEKKLHIEECDSVDIYNQYSVSPLLEEMAQRLQDNTTLTSLTIKYGYLMFLGGNRRLAKRSIHMVRDCFANVLSNNQTLKYLEFERADDYIDDRFFQSIANNTTLETLKLCFLKEPKPTLSNQEEYLKQIVVSICKSLSINRSLRSLEIGLPFRDDSVVNIFPTRS
ncbi:putative protein serine/threonine kinase [Cavenderia fasciculata]|uniref:non-specific serine/threonine protein kinase n=1 Tax=Cavenderia fasciculata TaxID=261658 RepID=F4PL32_CACFS|nr:putative protein serine/threonine kinase [Cavenderia fasciculata]EGG23254.1 putative protein serine/threonine kinase [Cavenderia fasciculata]|eukprot:XP_004361105.1 putative protein serine/threonine kinase [Cavenderia fasciculata]